MKVQHLQNSEYCNIYNKNTKQQINHDFRDRYDITAPPFQCDRCGAAISALTIMALGHISARDNMAPPF